MDAERARQALQEVSARQEQAIRVAYAPLPWWAVAGRFLIFAGAGVLGEIDPSGMRFGFPVVILLVYGAFEILRELTERRIGVKLRSSRRPAALAALNIGEAVVVLGVLILAGVTLTEADVPLHATLWGVITGAVAAALAVPVQRARYAILRSR